MTLKEVGYTISVAAGFGAIGLVLLVFFGLYPHHVVQNYGIAILLIAFILAVPYFILKFFFYINSRSQKDELHLKELPKDQDEISHEH